MPADPNPRYHAVYEREAPEGQSYVDWLWAELNTQLDILAESSRRLHHVVGPLELSLKLAQELERVG